ncbi:MAG: NAD+ synthase [Spirochaetota bacterium]
MRVTVSQLNPTVGDVDGNFKKIVATLEKAYGDRAELVVFPELFLTGYPPRDLLERDWFIRKVEQSLGKLCDVSCNFPELGIIVGAPVRGNRGEGKMLYNAALFILNGKQKKAQYKSLLPTYDVFDEARYFSPAKSVSLLRFRGEKLGITICEDAWNDPELWAGRRVYEFDPVAELARKGATLFINISASPFTIGKEELRFRLISNHARKHGVPFLYVNQIGSNDEIVFDGRSLLIDRRGNPAMVFSPFIEEVRTVDTGMDGDSKGYVPQNRIESVFQALVLGTRDYLQKSGFSKAIVGLSGGVDSSVTVCIAVKALGRENVMGVAMPSPYSSRESLEDAEALARNLGISFMVVPITEIFKSYLNTLEKYFMGKEPDITEENIQSRIRGNILMAFSNKFGYLVLSTGNKSELSVGYCTLYGDMSGGLSVISDVPKTMVYEIARYINRNGTVIPQEVLDKAPSAELKPGQKDQDTLPPYEILDRIINLHIEEGLGSEEIISRGFEPETVYWVIEAIRRSEYKRRQAPPGLKVTSKAFGIGRRIPIAARYRA